MKRLALISFSLFLLSTVAQAADVAVSISVGDPRFYGRIDIGDFPRPTLLFPQPIVIRPVVGVAVAPIYLRVPPGHAKDWAKHCDKYDACGRRVYFVEDRWYNDVYVPQYKSKHGNKHKGGGSDRGKGHGKDK